MIVEEAPAVDDKPAGASLCEPRPSSPPGRSATQWRSPQRPRPERLLHGGHHHQILEDQSRVPAGRWIVGLQVCTISQESRRQPQGWDAPGPATVDRSGIAGAGGASPMRTKVYSWLRIDPPPSFSRTRAKPRRQWNSITSSAEADSNGSPPSQSYQSCTRDMPRSFLYSR